MGCLFEVSSAELCSKTLFSGPEVLEAALACGIAKCMEEEAAFWAQWTIWCTGFIVLREEKGKVILLYPSCFLCFRAASHAPFPLFLSLIPLSLPYCPHSLPSLSFSRNGCSTGYRQLSIPVDLILVLSGNIKSRLHAWSPDPCWPQEVCPITHWSMICRQGSESLREKSI